MPTASENVCYGKTPNKCHTILAVKNPKLSRDINKISRYHDHISISLNVHTDILYYFFMQDFYTIVLDELVLEVAMRYRNDALTEPLKIITIKPGDMLRTDSLSCGCMDDLAMETEK